MKHVSDDSLIVGAAGVKAIRNRHHWLFSGALVRRWLGGELGAELEVRDEVRVAHPLERSGRDLLPAYVENTLEPEQNNDSSGPRRRIKILRCSNRLSDDPYQECEFEFNAMYQEMMGLLQFCNFVE